MPAVGDILDGKDICICAGSGGVGKTTTSAAIATGMAARGLKDSPLFTVTETSLNDTGLLGPRHVAEIRGWLAELGADADARDAMVKQTLEGAVRSLTRRAHFVADGYVQQSEAAERLRAAADAAYDEELRRLLDPKSLTDGGIKGAGT